MAETALELGTILEAAERAAAEEDFVSAEQHLRHAAALQERQLGAGHPDLANTLNNLGIVSEYLGKPADAETCYRRAYRIAAAALPADHPLVQTSGQNLRDFCEAAGKPFELRETIPPELEPFAPEPRASTPPPTRAPASPPTPAPLTPPPATPAPPAQPRATQPSPTQVPIAKPPLALSPSLVMPDLPLRRAEDRPAETPGHKYTGAVRTASPVAASSGRPTGALVIGIVLVLALGVWWFGFRESAQSTVPARSMRETPVPDRDAVTPREAPTPPVSSAPPEPPAARAPAESAPLVEVPARPSTADAVASDSEPNDTPPRSERASGDVSVADAKLCRSLSPSNWVCTPATSPASPGVFFYYTRVRSPRDTTVQHRWYVNGRLLRTVSLRIRANPGAGYRTYSRNTVNAERRGDWSIELRDADGALLDEERFTVQ